MVRNIGHTNSMDELMINNITSPEHQAGVRKPHANSGN